MQFIDEVDIEIKAGDGGDGAVAFRRERFRPNGGPSGGDGGHGGSVVFVADGQIGTLLDLRYKQRLQAGRGQNGQGRDCHGKCAEDLLVRVPVGTAVTDRRTKTLIGDLTEDGQTLLVARGGVGGLGNMHFTTSSNQAPQKATPGTPGEERSVRLELKLLADVGLVGFPSVGKSSIIARLSAAKPRIADYPFTTLVPHLGVVQMGPGESYVMADIPGLIEGASEGAGLGFRFLRHIQRTGILVFVLAPDPSGEFDLMNDFRVLNRELHSFDPSLATRKTMVVLNKGDLTETREAEEELREALLVEGLPLLRISAATGEGLDDLKKQLAQVLAEQKRNLS